MLPNLNRLALVTTGGNLANAKWDEDEVCSICLFPLSAPSPDERYAWAFSGDGTGFTAVACLQGHTFHKGCLRFMQRFNDTRCPDCRKPMFAEVLADVSRPDQEQIEREQRQAAEREQARAAREREAREDREREQRRRNPPAAESSNVSLVAQLRLEAMGFGRGEPGPQDPDDHFAMWTFAVKGLVQHSVVDDMRNHFYDHMNAVWEGRDPGSGWRRRLAIGMQWLDPRRDSTGVEEQMTQFRCKVFLPPRLVVSFVIWFRGDVVEYGYARSIRRILGISTAKRVGRETITNMGALDDHEAHDIGEVGQEGFGMAAEEYAAWADWDFRADDHYAVVEYEAPEPHIGDFAVQWTLLIKGHIPTGQRIWSVVRAFFGQHMREEWPTIGEDSVENWGRRLGIALRHGEVAPYSATHASMRIEFTRCRFRMHLPEAVARRFGAWLTERIDNRGYGEAMDEVLGIKGALKAGPARGVAIALLTGTRGEHPPGTENVLQVHEISTPAMTWREYQEWPEFEYRSAAAEPQGQANWMMEEAMAEMRESDPITNFHPPGGDGTDVTIRWRFWLKGPMSAMDRSNTPVHWRRSFAELMSNAPELPELRTSADPWFDRLWVWMRAEAPHIRGPRTGLQLGDGVVQRCEFALKLPADVATAWLMMVARGFEETDWNALAPTWFYVEPVWSNPARDMPLLDSSTLHPLVPAPPVDEAHFNSWSPWRNVQRFFAIGESR